MGSGCISHLSPEMLTFSLAKLLSNLKHRFCITNEIINISQKGAGDAFSKYIICSRCEMRNAIKCLSSVFYIH